MSDYEVNLVNDNMQEFYVRFYGPVESERCNSVMADSSHSSFSTTSTIRRRHLENTRRASRPIPLQVTQYRVHEQDLPSKYR